MNKDNAEQQRTAPDTKDKEAFSTRSSLFLFPWITFFLKNVSYRCMWQAIHVYVFFQSFQRILIAPLPYFDLFQVV